MNRIYGTKFQSVEMSSTTENLISTIWLYVEGDVTLAAPGFFETLALLRNSNPWHHTKLTRQRALAGTHHRDKCVHEELRGLARCQHSPLHRLYPPPSLLERDQL